MGYTRVMVSMRDTAVLRVCVREGFSRDLADMLLADLQAAVAHFKGLKRFQSVHLKRKGKLLKTC